MSPVSVIIPLAKGEQEWRNLLAELDLPEGSEIILATGDQPLDLTGNEHAVDIRIIRDGKGRAGQMNAGAAISSNEWLWFLHADTRLGEEALSAMRECVQRDTRGLFFFDLKFADDGPAAMNWNEWAVQWRAGRLKLPFGDQAFLMRSDLFRELGGYREDLKYGEDHILVWNAHHMSVPVERAGASVYTSARRYKDHGWLVTTLRFVWLTLWQAVPQWLTLNKIRARKFFS